MKEFNYTFDELFNPTLKALHNLSGSGSNSEIEEEVIKIMNLSDDEVNDIHRGSSTKLSYRLRWARNYLKRYGLLENSARGVWSLTEEGFKIKSVNKEKVKSAIYKIDKELIDDKIESVEKDTELKHEEDWQNNVIELIQSIPPENFERLCQRLLRELGFQNVEVTGRIGDGGIDGKGILKIGGVLSFHVVFQSKRYQGSVSPSVIRDFRGAMQGRADKGLLITTGTFSREAKKESIRDGAIPIDLIDGIALAEKLKELSLGIKTENVEKVIIDKDWFVEF